MQKGQTPSNITAELTIKPCGCGSPVSVQMVLCVILMLFHSHMSMLLQSAAQQAICKIRIVSFSHVNTELQTVWDFITKKKGHMKTKVKKEKKQTQQRTNTRVKNVQVYYSHQHPIRN